jgi:hypothetical protein
VPALGKVTAYFMVAPEPVVDRAIVIAAAAVSTRIFFMIISSIS